MYISPEIITLFAIVPGLIALVLVLLRKSPPQWDAGLSAELQRRQSDREFMDKLERAYQDASRREQDMFNAVVAVLRFVAPLTPGIRLDDAAVEFLEDIQQPGEQFHSAKTTLSDATIDALVQQLVSIGAIPAPEVNINWTDPDTDDPNLLGAAGQG